MKNIIWTMRARLTLATGYVYSLTGADIVAFTMDEGGGTGTLLGAAPAAYGRLTLTNPGGTWQPGGEKLGSRTLAGATVFAEIGVKRGEAWAYTPAGRFAVSSVEAGEGADTVTLSGYDGMLHVLNAPFTDTLVYPQPLSAILSHIASQSGCELQGEPACNQNVMIAQRPDWGEGCTLRRALGWTAGAMGCFVRFDRAGQLCLLPAWPGTESAALYAADTLRLTLSPYSFALNRVRVVPRGGQEPQPAEAALNASLPARSDNTLETGDNALFRPDAAELPALAQGLLAALTGMAFTPFDGDFVCDPALSLGQRVCLHDLRGNAHAAVITALRLSAAEDITLSLSCDPERGAPQTPTMLSGSGLLAGGALSEGIVTARHLAAGAVTAEKIEAGTITADKLRAGTLTSESGVFGAIDASSITAGKLDTDRLIIGGTEFSIVRALNLLAQTIVAGDDRIAGDVLADRTISAVKVTDDFGAGLELSSNAAVLLLAGKLDGTHSHMELTESAINMVGGDINIATNDLSIRGMDDGVEIMSLSPVGLTAGNVTVTGQFSAPNAVLRHSGNTIPWKGGIQASLDACPKYLSQAATLWIPAGTYAENVTLRGFLGEHLTLRLASGTVINGWVQVIDCSHVTLQGAGSDVSCIHPRGAQSAIYACDSALTVSNVCVSGYRGRTTADNGSVYAMDVVRCRIEINNTIMEYAKRGIKCDYGTMGVIWSCKGGRNGSDPATNANLEYGVTVNNGSHIGITGTIPMGGQGATSSWISTIAGSAAATAGGWTYTPPTEVTKTYACTAHCNYVTNTSESSNGVLVYQGRTGAYVAGDTRWTVGALWFGGTGELSGKTVKKATLTFRRGGAGYAEAAEMTLGGWPYAYGSHRNIHMPYNQVQSGAVVATLLREESATVDVTPWISHLQAGHGLAFCEPRNNYNQAQQNSDNYASVYANGSEFVATISVTYVP